MTWLSPRFWSFYDMAVTTPVCTVASFLVVHVDNDIVV